MSISPTLGLTIWDQDTDPYSHIQLAINFTTIDAHDHTSGRGKRITTLAIQDQAVTGPKLADGAVTTGKYADFSISSAKLATDSVNTRAIKPAAVGTTELADRSVTSLKLAEPIRPLGEIISWWRPTTATPVPNDWVPCDGRTLTAANHDFAGGGNLIVPDLRNKFILGADTGATGTGPATPPPIGQVGGTNLANLSHTHTVPHGHSGAGHTHAVNPHAHSVDSHTHGNTAHSHTVNAHTHVVGGHTHPVSAHSHYIDHIHGVQGHSHGIGGDGHHAHSIAGNALISRRSYIYPSSASGLEDRQTLYIGGFNAGGTSAVAYMDPTGSHSHGGGTGYTGGATGGSTAPYSAAAGATAEADSGFNTGSSNPQTDPDSRPTLSASPGTSSVPGTTGSSSANAITDTPISNPGLASQDLRPSYIGLLMLIKVKF